MKAMTEQRWETFRKRFRKLFQLDPAADLPLILFQIGMEHLAALPPKLSKEDKLRVMDIGLVALMVDLGLAAWKGEYDGCFPLYIVDKERLRAFGGQQRVIQEGLMRRYEDVLSPPS